MRQQILNAFASTLSGAHKLVDDVPCARFADLPYPGAKHPAWVLTHLCVGAGMGLSVLEHPDRAEVGSGGVPDDWRSAGDAEPVAERSVYPSRADLITALDDLHERYVHAFGNTDDVTLARAFPNPEWRSFFPTVGDATFYLMTFHEGYHLGQLSQWRRAAGFGPAGV